RADQTRDRLKLREINELALAGASAVPYSYKHGQRAGIAAGHVGIGIAPACRLFAWMAHEQGVAGQGLERGAVADVVFLRSGVAEARHADRDDVGLDLLEAGVVHAPVAHNPRAEVVDHHVGDGNELAGDLAPTRVGHVDDRTFLPAEEVPREPAAAGAHIERVAPLDFDHLRALVGQNARGYWPSHNPREVKNPDTL